MVEQVKKKSGFLKKLLIGIGIFIVLGTIGAIGSRIYDSAGTSDGSGAKQNSEKTDVTLYNEAQALFNSGKYADALGKIDKAIKINKDEKYEKLKTDTTSKIASRKEELEKKLKIKNDKVENVTFISPDEKITKGLTFYPYIGIKDSEKYMLLRVGYQESVKKTLFAFTSIKVRAGEDLQELDFNLLDKKSDVDILGTGITELADVEVDNKVMELLETKIPNSKEVIVRFQDVSNKTEDYTLTDKQREAITNILEYYSYLE